MRARPLPEMWLSAEQALVVSETLAGLGKGRERVPSDPDARSDGWSDDAQWVAKQTKLLERWLWKVGQLGKRDK